MFKIANKIIKWCYKLVVGLPMAIFWILIALLPLYIISLGIKYFWVTLIIIAIIAFFILVNKKSKKK